jgi:hypothetical protein
MNCASNTMPYSTLSCVVWLSLGRFRCIEDPNARPYNCWWSVNMYRNPPWYQFIAVFPQIPCLLPCKLASCSSICDRGPRLIEITVASVVALVFSSARHSFNRFWNASHNAELYIVVVIANTKAPKTCNWELPKNECVRETESPTARTPIVKNRPRNCSRVLK